MAPVTGNRSRIFSSFCSGCQFRQCILRVMIFTNWILIEYYLNGPFLFLLFFYLGALYMVTDISIRKDIPNKSVLDTQVASVCLLNNLFLFAKAIYWPVTATLLPYNWESILYQKFIAVISPKRDISLDILVSIWIIYRFLLATAFFVQKKKDFPKFWISLVLVLRGVVPILIYLVTRYQKANVDSVHEIRYPNSVFFYSQYFFPLRYQDNIRLLWEFSYYPKIYVLN